MPASVTAQPTDVSHLTPEELDELLNVGDQSSFSTPKPFFTTLPGVLLLGTGVLLLVGLVVAAGVAVAWRRGLGRLAVYQQPYAQLIRLGRWSGALRLRTGDTPLEVAERLGRQVPRAQPAIDELTDAYVEGTYADRTPRRDPWPAWLAARRDVIRGLFSRRFGGWFGEDSSVALPPRGHPELLSRWGARRSPRE
jgi:hypothetical protein